MKPYNKAKKAHHQLDASELIKIIEEQKNGERTDSGAIAINTGKFTGRSPKDRFIVKENLTEDKVNWGEINLPISMEKYQNLKMAATRGLALRKKEPKANQPTNH